MKRIVSIIAALTLSVSSMMAQSDYITVKGYVVDKNGCPIPGAEVTARGGDESAITDSDGSFSMNVQSNLKKLIATYDGMETKTIRIKPDSDLIFSLQKERENPAFLTLTLGYSRNMQGEGRWRYNWSPSDVNAPSFGIMAGMLGKWGFYGKGNCDWNGNFSVTAGVVKSIYQRQLFIYAGAGYGMAERYYTYLTLDPDLLTWKNYLHWEYRPGIAADFGFIYKIGYHFNLTIGYNLIVTPSYESHHGIYVGANFVHGAQIGFGYVF